MPDYRFTREARTESSEAYTIEDGGDEVGRVDLHFTTNGTVHATLCVGDGFEDEALEDLIGTIDERLVGAVEPYRDDFVVTVWAGRRVGVFSEDFDEDEEYSEGEENGKSPSM